MSPSLHRIQPPLAKPEVYTFGAPFSSFDFVESHFDGCWSIRRAFSLARATGKCNAVVVERIGLCGILADDNAELASMGFSGGSLVYRVSFWEDKLVQAGDLSQVSSDGLIGYFIAKCDGVTGDAARWYVFESVFRKYDHPHNCVPRALAYRVRIGDGCFDVSGFLYCQQNGLNKACAHVALRSILSRLIPEGDISYSRINEIAGRGLRRDCFKPSAGLTTAQIKAVLNEFSVSYCDMDYEAAEDNGISDIRNIHPYQNDLYAGIESGCGALLGFRLGDPTNPVSKHIIPFYGHTFNKDTWVTDAENFYFKIGSDAGYIPSVNWTSSFIGHDDNFGSSFCVPRLYVKPEQVDYVAAIYPHGVRLMGSDIASMALPILSELYPAMPRGNKWLSRLKAAFAGQVPQIVFRAVCIEAKRYFDMLAQCRDWEGRSENVSVLSAFKKVPFPKMFQVVEVSVPQLFAANERKIGEIVFNANNSLPDDWNDIARSPFLFARLPGAYFVLDIDQAGNNCFSTIPSSLMSHVSVFAEC